MVNVILLCSEYGNKYTIQYITNNTFLGEKLYSALFLSVFCYSESFIRVIIVINQSLESPQLDIELQLMLILPHQTMCRS